MEELYREYSKIVYRFLLSLCRDAQLAEELTQETFLQAFLSLERFDGSCKLSVWLCQIARHLFYQHLRKTACDVPTEQSRIPESVAADNTERAAVTKLELMDVLKEVQKLPPQMREVIYLRVMGQLSFREIGEIVGKSDNWARVTFYR